MCGFPLHHVPSISLCEEKYPYCPSFPVIVIPSCSGKGQGLVLVSSIIGGFALFSSDLKVLSNRTASFTRSAFQSSASSTSAQASLKGTLSSKSNSTEIFSLA